jgi:hypothetical protein
MDRTKLETMRSGVNAMNNKLMNTITAAALSALVLAPLATVGTFAMTDTAWAAGKGKDKSRSKDRRSSRSSNTSTNAKSTAGSQAGSANAHGMAMKAAAMEKKAVKLASLSSDLAPSTSPFPAPRPNRGQFASEWKAMNAIWANENAFENASDNSRLARIMDYRDALVTYNDINAVVSYDGPAAADIQGLIDDGLANVEGFADSDEYALLLAELALAQAHEADQLTANEVCDDGEPPVCTTYTDAELALIDAEGDVSDALDTAAAGAEPPDGDALAAFNELLLSKFPADAE